MKRAFQIFALAVAVFLAVQPAFANPSCNQHFDADYCAAKCRCMHMRSAVMQMDGVGCTGIFSVVKPLSCNHGECSVASTQIASPAESKANGIAAFIPGAPLSVVTISGPFTLLCRNPEASGPARYILLQVFLI
jgi:hypothetical protein